MKLTPEAKTWLYTKHSENVPEAKEVLYLIKYLEETRFVFNDMWITTEWVKKAADMFHETQDKIKVIKFVRDEAGCSLFWSKTFCEEFIF